MSIEEKQNRLNEKFNYITIIKYIGNDVYLYKDSEYGEFDGKFSDVIRGQRKHYKRQTSLKNLPLEEIKFRLNKANPHLTLLEYNGSKKTAKFLDKDYGEFSATFNQVFNKRTNHPNRSLYNKSQTFKKQDVQAKIKKTMIEKYGTEKPMHSEIIKSRLKKTNQEKYGVDYVTELPEFQEKVKKTNQEKYGVNSSLQIPEIKEKIKNTNLKKYGVENPFQSEEIQNKINKVKLDKYGVECLLQLPEIRKRIEETNLEKYGTKSPTQSDQIKSKVIENNIKKYGVEHAFQSEIVKNKIKKTNLEKYGVDNPLKNEEIKLKAQATSLEKYNTKVPSQSDQIKEMVKKNNIKNNKIRTIDGKTIKEFIKDKDFSVTTAHKIIREQGGEFLLNYNKKYSSIEQIIKNILEKHAIKYSQQFYIEGSFADFYIPEHKLIIECDGLYWHSDIKKEKKYHKNKLDKYNRLGYRALFFREDEINDKITIIESIILAKLGKFHNRVFARKTTIIELKPKDAASFFENNHLMGRGSGKCYALSYNNEIVSAIRIIRKKDYIDVSRFCSALNTSVIGGLGKLTKHVWKKHNPPKISSFVDMRYGDGHSLKKLGFKEKTNYVSFKWTDFKQTFHRQNFWGVTGYNLGLLKIWDCGQKKFELE